MKKIILIILALTLLVISCKKKDDDDITGPGGGAGNNSAANTPEAKAWKSNVGGKTFTDATAGESIVFNNNGLLNDEEKEETNKGVTYTVKTVWSFKKAISANRVIAQAKITVVGESEVSYEYVAYDLSEDGKTLKQASPKDDDSGVEAWEDYNFDIGNTVYTLVE